MNRVLYVIGQLEPGGTENQLLLLAKGLDRTKFSPLVVALRGGTLADDFRNNNIDLIVIGEGGKLSKMASLAKIIRNVSPSIIHAYDYALNYAVPAGLLTNSRCIIAARRLAPQFIRGPRKTLDSLTLRMSRMVMVNSKAVLSYVVKQLGVKSTKCRLIYNGCNLDDDPSLFIKREKSDFFKIVCVANLRAQKRHDVLIEAFHKVCRALSQRGLSSELWLVGMDFNGAQASLEKIINRDKEIAGKVVFCGYRKDVNKILQKCDVAVLASDYEGLPNAIIEYMAVGLPIVATDVSGTNELIIDNKTGILIAPREPGLLAEGLLKVLLDAVLAERLGTAAKKWAHENLSVERMVSETQAVYEEILDNCK